VASLTISSGAPRCVRFYRTNQMSDTTESDGLVAETKIEINLNRLSQLFNSLDPSPFHERDLDQDAEDYIVGSAEEAPRQHPLRLVIHLPAEQLPHTGVPDLATFRGRSLGVFDAGRIAAAADLAATTRR